MDYYTARARVLNREAEQQEAIVEALKRAVGEAADKYGYASSQVQGYKIQLNNAEAKQIQLAKAAQQANRDLEELGRDSGKIGREIERGIGDAAEDTSEKLDGMFAKVQKDVNALKSSVAVQVGMELGGAVFDALQGAVDFVEESREYRRLQSFAEQSAIRNNLDIAEVERYANEIAVFFGDYDAAVETVAVLTEAGFKGETLGMAVDNLIGAAIAYYNTLNTESLAESIQETIATGELTGQYAELVDRLQGMTMITAEDLEKELQAAKTQEEKLELLMSPLTEAGMQSNKFDYEARNKELLKAAEAERALQEAWADLAAEIEPVVTGIVTGTTALVDGLTNIIERVKEFNESHNIVDLFPGAGETSVPPESDMNTPEAQEYYKKLTEKLLREGVGGNNKPKSGLIANALGGLGLVRSASAETLPTSDLQDYGFRAAQEVATGMMQGMEGNEAVEAAVKTAIAEMDAQDVIDSARLAGKNLMIEFGNGIAEGTAIPINNVASMVNQINAMLAQIATPAFGLGWSGITGGNIYLYNQQKNAASSISRFIGRGVMNTTLSKK